MVATINLAENSQPGRAPRAMRRVNHSYFPFSNVGGYVVRLLCHLISAIAEQECICGYIILCTTH